MSRVTALARPISLFLVGWSLAWSNAVFAAEPAKDDVHREFTLSGGLDYSTGDYSDDDTTSMWYLPLMLKFEQDAWIAKVTVPYLRITGPGNVVGGTDGALVTGRRATGRSTNSGPGDVVTSLTYAMYPSSETMPTIDFTGKVKFPTADEDDGLGTGEFDYSAQIDISKTFARVTPFLTTGYRWLGDPSGVNLDNVFFGSLGFVYKFSGRFSGGLVYDYKQAAISGIDASHEAVLFGSIAMSHSIRLNPYFVIGLSDSSPDYGLGFNVAASLR